MLCLSEGELTKKGKAKWMGGEDDDYFKFQLFDSAFLEEVEGKPKFLLNDFLFPSKSRMNSTSDKMYFYIFLPLISLLLS